MPETFGVPDPARVARVTILAADVQGVWTNLVTVVRDRHRSTVGPWIRPADDQWSTCAIREDLQLLSIDVEQPHAVAMVANMLGGECEAASHTIRYSTRAGARRTSAWRDFTVGPASELHSPFAEHSAEVNEHWGFDDSLMEFWISVRDDLPEEALAGLGIDLTRFIDRVGNILIFSAIDDITSDLDLAGETSIRLSVRSRGELEAGIYRACVWAYQGQEPLLHQLVDVQRPDFSIAVDGDVDHLGFEMFRISDGLCIDYFDVYKMRSVGIAMEFTDSQVTVNLPRRGRNRGSFQYTMSRREAVTTSVEMTDLSGDIFRAQRHRRADEDERKAQRQQLQLYFGPGRSADAMAQLCRFVRTVSDRQPIYLADRYFGDLNETTLETDIQHYASLFSATGGHPLRILVCRKDRALPAWWRQIPQELRSNVEVRGAYLADSQHNPLLDDKEKPLPAFHDRYLIAGAREVLLTHSLNGWERDGVTMVTLHYGVYRSQAEMLWSLPLGGSARYFIERLS